MNESNGSPHRLELDGEWDLSRKEELAALFGALDGRRPVEIDLSRVTYLDSTVLRELIALRLRCKSAEVTIAAPNSNIRKILRIAKLDRLFRITDSN